MLALAFALPWVFSFFISLYVAFKNQSMWYGRALMFIKCYFALMTGNYHLLMVKRGVTSEVIQRNKYLNGLLHAVLKDYAQLML